MKGPRTKLGTVSPPFSRQDRAGWVPVWDRGACYQGVFAAREELVMKGENANVLGMERPMQHHDAVTPSIYIFLQFQDFLMRAKQNDTIGNCGFSTYFAILILELRYLGMKQNHLLPGNFKKIQL